MELFLLECQEYVKHQLLRFVFIVVGLLFLVLSYLALWVTVVVLMTQWWSLLIAVATCFFFHFLLGLIFMITSLLMKSKPFAPATREEWQYDVTCARLSLKGKNS